MALTKWDHVVHYVNNIDQPISTFQENGLVAFRGGSHKQWGTYNSLSYFDLTYIEFLGIEDRDLVASIKDANAVVKDSIKVLPEHEILSRVALRTDHIEEVAANLHSHNVAASPIIAGKRLDKQGHLIEWQMLTIDGDFQGLPYPFVIQWKETDDKRYETLLDQGIIQEHPAGNIQLNEAIFSVANPSAVAEHWKALFGLQIVETNEVQTKLAIDGKTFIFQQSSLNQFTELVFTTNSDKLIGKTLVIGEGKYTFK